VNSAALLDPSKATEHALATFRVKLETTKGPVVLEVVRDWAPNGADRFYNLVKIGFYNDVAFFRVIDGFMAQFGIHGDPKVAAKWREARIADDPVKQSNLRGFVSFATAGPNTRTTQLFINYADRNAQLDRSGFAPFARVIQGMEVVDSLYSGYGEGAPNGAGPNQGLVQMQGNAYLRANFPKLDYIKTATIVE
jgi:peptidyl-prolyl cis-trans isomerase A (cyclophilin A)